MTLDSTRRLREPNARTASAVWRFGEETLVSDPFSGGALIRAALFLFRLQFPPLTNSVQPPRLPPLRFSPSRLPRDQVHHTQPKKKSGRPVARPPHLDRHSEVLLCMASPGSGWATKVNFSNNSNSILNIAQSRKRNYTTEYSDNFSLGDFPRTSVLCGRTFPWGTVQSTRFP